jgi:hypothetical protein
MAPHPDNPFRVRRTDDPAGCHGIPGRIVFWITGHDTADLHPARRMDEISFAQVKAHMVDPLFRTTEKEQITGLKIIQPADIYRFTKLGLL